jgi:hypothetical protein
MIRQNLTPQDALAVLKDLFATDPEAMRALVAYRVPCNSEMEAHPTAQVSGNPPRIGLLGVLNALFGTLGPEAGKLEGYGPIAGVFDEHGMLIDFNFTDPRMSHFKTDVARADRGRSGKS